MALYMIDLYRGKGREHSFMRNCESDDDAIEEAGNLMDRHRECTMAIVDRSDGFGVFKAVATITENVLPVAVILEGEAHGI